MKLLEKSQEKRPIEDEITTINLDNPQVDHTKNKTILWWGIKEEANSLSKMMMWQKQYALKLLNFMKN